MLLVECPNCKKRISEKTKECHTATGSGCGTPLPLRQRIYWVQYRVDGKSKTKKIGPSRSAAVNYERKVKVEIAENKYIDKRTDPEITVRDFVKEIYSPWCKTNNRGYSNKRYFIDAISREWGSRLLDHITYGDVAIYQQSFMMSGKKIMFNRILATLKHMYTHAIKTGYIQASPLGDVNDLRFEENGRVRYLEPGEVVSLLSNCNPLLRAIVTTAVNTGGRKSEILGLKVGDLDLKNRLLTFKLTKNGEPRHIPINEALKEQLAPYLEDKCVGDYVFTKNNGKPQKCVREAFTMATRNAGIENFTFHDLRHTFASNLVMQGVDLYVVKELLGHSTIRMTEKYSHLAPDHKARAVNVLDGLFDN